MSFEYDSDSDISESSSIMDQEIHSIPEEILDEIEENIFMEMDDFVKTNLESYSSPDFHENAILQVSDAIYQASIESNLFDPTEANRFEIVMMTKEASKKFFYETKIFPPRSYPPNTTLEEYCETNQQYIEDLQHKIKYLKSIPQPPQKTQEWYEFRNNLITASNIYKALGTESQQNSLIYEKCKPQQNHVEYESDTPLLGARGWGHKYEPITAKIYEAMYLGNNLDTGFGCIQHFDPTCSFIGASPDGIVVNGPRTGHLVEIKNTVSREITDTPIESHWILCQIQMEVCDLPYCDYIQTSIKEITWKEFEEEQMAEYKGVFLHLQRFEDNMDDIPFYKYIYMPFYLLHNADPVVYETIIHSWMYDVVQESPQYFVVDVIYWKLEEMSCVVIPRNREWFQSVLPRFQEIWKKIEDARNEPKGYEKYAPKRRNAVGVPNNELLRSFRVSLLPAEQEQEPEQHQEQI
jgi:hypothetical protein